MKIGIPKETKLGEYRVAIIPDHVRLLTEAGHEVFVQKDVTLDPKSLLGKRVDIRWTIHKEEDRYFNGYITKVTLPKLSTLSKVDQTYELEIRPYLWFLAQNKNCQIYEKKTVEEIIVDMSDDEDYLNETINKKVNKKITTHINKWLVQKMKNNE